MKNDFAFLPQLIKRGIFFILVVCGLLTSTTISAQLPTAKQITSKMKLGWNLGNTLEATWATPGNASQRLIDSVKAAGFNSVRLPCAWFNNSDTITSIIKPAYLAQVKKNVDYCINNNMYVMINIHWDKGWLENRVTVADSAIVNARQKKYWTQIANYFKNYDEHLLFACANEPNNDDLTAGGKVMESYIQTFIKAVRATGGNNSSRTLIFQGHPDYSTIPKDEIADRLIFEAHSYGFQFALQKDDMLNPWCGGCGSMLYCIYYWGKGNHSATDLNHNPSYDEEADIDNFFGNTLKTRFVDKGVPVILGEYAAWKRGTLAAGADRALHNKSIEYYYYYMVKSALKNGAIPFVWDTGSLFDRNTGTVQDWGIINAMKKGANEVNPTWIGLPAKIEAENFSSKSGMQAETTGDIGGGQNLGYIGDGNWAEYTIENNTTNTEHQISFRLAAPNTGGVINFYIDDVNVGSVSSPNTGNWQVYQSVVSNITISPGKHYLKVVATKAGFNFNYMDIQAKTLGLNNVTHENVYIYPNPVSNELIVNSADFQYDKIDIFDTLGKLVMSRSATKEPVLRIPVDLSDGMYFVKISNTTQYQIKKIVVVNK